MKISSVFAAFLENMNFKQLFSADTTIFKYSNTPKYAYPADRPSWIVTKNSRYANFSDLSTSSYAIFDFVGKKIPDMLILVIHLPPAMLFLILSLLYTFRFRCINDLCCKMPTRGWVPKFANYALFKNYISDQAVLQPKWSPHKIIILVK